MLSNLFLSLVFLVHPFYVSVTEVTHNSKTKRLEISCKIFFNDLEAALEKQGKTQLDILKPEQRDRIDLLLNDYLQQHLQLRINGKPVALKYLGYEIEQEAAWCYLEVLPVNRVKQIEIKNDILFSEHASQTNMLHLTVNGARKSTKLDNPESVFKVSF